jgi:hypothetical protein
VSGFQWEAAGKEDSTSGKTLLVGARGPVAIFNFYNYITAFDERTLLVWHQSSSWAPPTAPVRLLVIEPALLKPLDTDLRSLCERMNAEKEFVSLGGDATAELSLATANTDDELTVGFPTCIQEIEELLILCNSSGIARQAGSGMLALMVANPRKGSYRLYPQDWFNKGGVDLGYQWVTRVARNPRTGHIHGEGFRISPFVLDDSLRGLRSIEHSR